jgi:hypothetical protein
MSPNTGLRAAKKCILLLSPEFVSNPGWTKAEFNAVVGVHIGTGGSVILPVWHRVSWDDVFHYSPIVADI